MTFAERFGQNIADARRRADLTQEALAVDAEIHRTAISKIERGETIPQADTVAKLAGGIGISPEDFFIGIRWLPGEPPAPRVEGRFGP